VTDAEGEAQADGFPQECPILSAYLHSQSDKLGNKSTTLFVLTELLADRCSSWPPSPGTWALVWPQFRIPTNQSPPQLRTCEDKCP
jgi:hypothetical protein